MVLNENPKIPSTRELFRSIRTIRGDWKLKTPLQKWCYLYGIGRAALYPPRVPSFEDDDTISFRSYQGIIYATIYVLLAFYTLWYHIIRGEFYKALPCTCILSMLLAVSLQTLSCYSLSFTHYKLF